jgi:hypothetical protein
VEGGDELDDVARFDFVHAQRPEQRERPVEGDAVQHARDVADVDPRGAPDLSRFAQRQHLRRLSDEQPQVRDAQGGELSGDPLLADRRLAHRLERTAVEDPCLATEEPVLDAVAPAAVAGGARPNPDASHGTGGVG